MIVALGRERTTRRRRERGMTFKREENGGMEAERGSKEAENSPPPIKTIKTDNHNRSLGAISQMDEGVAVNRWRRNNLNASSSR